MDCTTRDEYNLHVAAVYQGFIGYPKHILYFEKYFNNPDAIAKWSIKKIRGGLLTIGSTAAEQLHSSNEVAVPTKLMGILSPEDQLLELVRRSDNWIRRDLTEGSKLEFEQARLSRVLEHGSPEYLAMKSLTRHAFKNMFHQSWKRTQSYRKKPVHDEFNQLTGHEIYYNDHDQISCFISLEGRCPRDDCASFDVQCVHELVNDNDFLINKWNTRFWNDKTYRLAYGEGSHLPPQNSFLTCGSLCDNLPDPVGGDYDGDPMVGSPDDGPSTTKMNNKRRGKRGSNSADSVPTYTELMNEFQSLASDLASKPNLSRIWQGLIVATKEILHDSPSNDTENDLLSLATSTKANMVKICEGVAPESLQLIPKNSVSDKIDLSNVPITKRRTDKQGAPMTNRLQNCHEKRSMPKTAKCGLCGIVGHRMSGNCARRKTFGSLVMANDVPQLVQDLTMQCSISLNSVVMHSDILRLEQLPPRLNFIVINGYAIPPGMNDSVPLSQGTTREDTHFTCVTCIYHLGVVEPMYDNYFVKTSAVTSWMQKTSKNKKKVIKAHASV